MFNKQNNNFARARQFFLYDYFVKMPNFAF